MRLLYTSVAGAAFALCLSAGSAASEDLVPLPRLNVDPDAISVSGLSSGAFMAVQVQTVRSADVMGAAIFAGGPFGCARGDLDIPTLSQAIQRCVDIKEVQWLPFVSDGSYLGPPEVAPLVDGARRLEAAGAIDPLAGLADDAIYLFSGKADATVHPGVMRALEQWYREWVPAENIVADYEVDAGHAMITTDWKNDCAITRSPYINDCDLDAAGVALSTIYGPLKSDPAATGAIIAFDQQAFVPDDAPDYNGMHEVAHAFIPDTCADGSKSCKLHVVFHGCGQNQDFIGDQYWTRTGYNTHAAANDIVVLYPQTKASDGMPNPKGCWDWWGFTDKDALEPGVSYLTKHGTQQRAIWAMIQHLSGQGNM